MAKQSKKSKGPQRSNDNAARLQNGMSQITSQIEAKLNGNPYKRKNPPTEVSGKPKQRKQRDSEGAPATNGTSDDKDALLAEIKALGGDEEDWRLINDVASDDEVTSGSKAPVDKGLKDELAALSKELGFSGIIPDDASDEEEEEEEGVEEEDEEEDEDDNESEEEVSNKNKKKGNSETPKAPKEKGPAENEMRRVEGLVS